jgi:hypothetical protein
VVVGVLFVAAGVFSFWRVVTGDVSTRVPGEPGSASPVIEQEGDRS